MFIDLKTAEALYVEGWRQTDDGLKWCPACSKPTVWIAPSGKPLHPGCEDV